MATRHSRSASLASRLLTNDRLATPMLLVWMGLLLVGVVWDQILLLPSPPPTDLQLSGARPVAAADWKAVYARIAQRRSQDGLPPEFGEVWTTRTGRICGLVNGREGGVDYMTRFYADDRRPVLREDDRRAYVRWWLDCLDTRWIRLHAGTEKTGLCASRRGRDSAFGREVCQGDAIRPIPMQRYPNPQ